LRRNYLWIFFILYAAWVAKIWLFPVAPANVEEFVIRASVGPISGQVMIILGMIFYIFLGLVAIGTVNMTRATGEVLPRFGDESASATSLAPEDVKPKGLRAWLAPRHRRRQLLALIITGKAETVSNRILTDLGRGVTAVSGKGMYTGSDRTVLLCALTVTEVHNLKTAVAKEDPQAFVIVSPAQEILGRGFNPLEEESERK
jgi:hypothetical protein